MSSSLSETPSKGTVEGGSKSSEEVAECRICQAEDLLSNLDSPCDCKGSLQYVHPDCLQKWANEKGSLACEICTATYRGRGNYTVQATSSSESRNVLDESAYPAVFVGRISVPFGDTILQLEEEREQESGLCSRKVMRTYLSMLLAIISIHTILMIATDDDEDSRESPLNYLVSDLLLSTDRQMHVVANFSSFLCFLSLPLGVFSVQSAHLLSTSSPSSKNHDFSQTIYESAPT